MVSTFLPVADFRQSSEMLDGTRLGKQRSEIKIILAALTGVRFKQWKGEHGIILPTNRGYQNHAITKMWRGYEFQLAHLGHVNCQVWAEKYGHEMKQGAKGWDTACDMYSWKMYLMQKHMAGEDINLGMPPWFGDERVHSSHRQVLLSKDEEFYRQYGWSEEAKYEYFYPV